MSTPVLNGQCPALVIAPSATDLQIPRREPLATEAETLNKSTRGFITWLDVRLYAMKTEAAENPAQRQSEALGHVSTAHMRDKSIVAEVGTAKVSAHDLVDVDDSNEFPRRPENDEFPLVGRGREALDIGLIRG